MGIWFECFSPDCCCLCGSAENLTGEHKIKVSVLRAIFGRSAMVIGHFDGQSRLRNAQGPKSRAFHFEARMCSSCNGTQTQEADREFDLFHSGVMSIINEGRDPISIFEHPRYKIGSDAYLNIFRYFSKLLACQIADSRGPRTIHLTNFARGISDRNPIFLAIDLDPTYANYVNIIGEHAYAAHGGLVVSMNLQNRLPTSFRTTLTIGAVRYLFWARFGIAIGLAIMFAHREFYKKCRIAFEDALSKPLSEDERHRLGV